MNDFLDDKPIGYDEVQQLAADIEKIQARWKGDREYARLLEIQIRALRYFAQACCRDRILSAWAKELRTAGVILG
jgi:hypothetical protein